MPDIEHEQNQMPKQPVSWTGTVIKIIGVLLLLGIIAVLFFPAIEGGSAPRRPPCQNDLRQIALALQSYHAALGCFPPAYIVDANGRPMHSWRALLLPYLEAPETWEITKQYDYNQPWDSPHNRALMDKMPAIFRCPSGDLATGRTTYVTIVGPETIFPGSDVRKETDVSDGLSKTIMVIESEGPGVNWLEPVDLTSAEVRAGALTASDTAHKGGTNVICADGSVHFLTTGQLTSPKIDGLISIDGQEPADLPQ